jgi:transcriptional regulator
MYIPKLYRVEDLNLICEFIRENSFGTLITRGTPYPIATHIPMELEQDGEGRHVLTGHISRANPQLKEMERYPEALAVFLSPVHQYISSSWYSIAEVPTWNYMSVHVSGKMRILNSEELYQSVNRLTNRYEKDSVNPVSLDKLPASVLKQFNGIAGFKLSMEKSEASFKLSQNRSEKDFQNILTELRQKKSATAHLLADAMEKHSTPKGKTFE